MYDSTRSYSLWVFRKWNNPSIWNMLMMKKKDAVWLCLVLSAIKNERILVGTCRGSSLNIFHQLPDATLGFCASRVWGYNVLLFLFILILHLDNSSMLSRNIIPNIYVNEKKIKRTVVHILGDFLIFASLTATGMSNFNVRLHSFDFTFTLFNFTCWPMQTQIHYIWVWRSFNIVSRISSR